MTATFKELEEQAQTLAGEDRAKLAETLLDSLQMPVGEIQTAWAEEIEERVAAFDAGETKTFAAEYVFAEARHLDRRDAQDSSPKLGTNFSSRSPTSTNNSRGLGRASLLQLRM